MTSLFPFSKLLNALKLNTHAQAVTSAEAIDRAVLSLHSVISDPVETPEAVKVAKRLLLRLLENPKTAEHATEAEIPAAVLFRVARNPDSEKWRSLVPRIAIARTATSRKGRAISSADRSHSVRSDIRRGVVTSSSKKEGPSHAAIA